MLPAVFFPTIDTSEVCRSHWMWLLYPVCIILLGPVKDQLSFVSLSGLWHRLYTTAQCWAVQNCWRRTCCVWSMLTKSIRSNIAMRTDCVTASPLVTVTTRLCLSAASERLHVSHHQRNALREFSVHQFFSHTCRIIPKTYCEGLLLCCFRIRSTLTPLFYPPSGPSKHRSAQRVWTQDDSDRAAAVSSLFLYDTQHLLHYVRAPQIGPPWPGPSVWRHLIRASQGLWCHLVCFGRAGLASRCCCFCCGLWSPWTLMWFTSTQQRYVHSLLASTVHFLRTRSEVTGVLVSQVYPTVARSLGMGFCTSFSRIGGMIAPFIAQVRWLSCLMIRVFRFLVQSIIALCVLQVLMSQSVILALCPFAVACVLCALGNFLMPIETKGRALLVRMWFCMNFVLFSYV